MPGGIGKWHSCNTDCGQEDSLIPIGIEGINNVTVCMYIYIKLYEKVFYCDIAIYSCSYLNERCFGYDSLRCLWSDVGFSLCLCIYAFIHGLVF